MVKAVLCCGSGGTEVESETFYQYKKYHHYQNVKNPAGFSFLNFNGECKILGFDLMPPAF